MCCEFIKQRKKVAVVGQPPTWVNYATTARNPIATDDNQMAIRVNGGDNGMPTGAAVGDVIRFTATGADIPIVDIIQIVGQNAIVVGMNYETYKLQPNIYYLQAST